MSSAETRPFSPAETGQKPDITPIYSSRVFDILALSSVKGGFNINPGESLKPPKALQKIREEAARRREEKQKLRNKEMLAYGVKRITPPIKHQVGVLGLEINGNEVSFNTMALTKSDHYDEKIGLTNPTEEGENLRQELGNPLGSAVVLFTKDGYFAVQDRSRKNDAYRKIGGGSAGGYPSEELDKTNPGALLPFDLEHDKKAMAEIIEGEIGISPEHLQNMEFIGVAKDKLRVHYEFLHLAKVDLTAAELKDMALKNAPKSYETDNTLYEQFYTIKATPENILKLLKDVRVPFSPTHTALFVAAGRALILEQSGEAEAEKWTQLAMQGIEENSVVIEATIIAATEGTKTQYDPYLNPEDMGLPDFVEELARLKLIPNKRRPKIVLFADHDGVFNDIESFDVEHEEIIDNQAIFIDRGNILIGNTGRTVDYLYEGKGERSTFKLLAKKIKDKSKLETNVFSVGEMGGTKARFVLDPETGIYKWDSDYNKDMMIPKLLQDKIREKINQYSDERIRSIAVYEEGKVTMATITKMDGATIDDYSAVQEQLLVRLINETIQEEFPELADDITVGTTKTGTDLFIKFMGKGTGALVGAKMLEDNNIEPGCVMVIGDSPSDMDMIAPLKRLYFPVIGIYLGDPKKLSKEQRENSSIFVTKNRYDHGFLDIQRILNMTGFGHFGKEFYTSEILQSILKNDFNNAELIKELEDRGITLQSILENNYTSKDLVRELGRRTKSRFSRGAKKVVSKIKPQ
jgi:hypothetical protein